MSQIATMKVMTGGEAKDVRVYSLDDTNIEYKGVRIQTPNGVGCLNFVTSGGDIPSVRIQTPSAVRHLKSYSYTENVDVVKTYDNPLDWMYGTETIVSNGTTWTVTSYGFLLSDQYRMINTTMSIKLNSSNTGSTNFLNRKFYLYYYNGASMVKTSFYITPTALDTWFSGSFSFSDEVLIGDNFRYVFVCESNPGTTYNMSYDCKSFQYKKETTIYH